MGDITKIHGDKIDPVDCITFGSPCQGLSMAGKRLGFDDNRSVLFLDAARIIKEMRTATNGMYPTFAVWENVPYVLKRIRHVLPHRPSWILSIGIFPHFSDNAHGFEEETGTAAVQTGALASDAEILANRDYRT